MTTSIPAQQMLLEPGGFPRRHIGPTEDDIIEMLDALGYESLSAFVDAAVPEGIRYRRPLQLPAGLDEHEALARLRAMAAQNVVARSFIGMGYYDTLMPPVIQRNIFENPGWYTAYTPYQAEIAQGRLEALLTYQTMVSDLTALPIANASLLDEGTAAAEAMAMCHGAAPGDRARFLVAEDCHPQTIDVVRTRAAARGFEIVVGDAASFSFDETVFGVLLQYPATDGAVHDYRALCEQAHAAKALVVVATDLLALTLLAPPGEWGADVAVGNSQRFGVPLGFGGPHAAFFATRDEYKRMIPGRIIGVSRDSAGRPALRMALQTREQHIRREKATSNVCTAQVLLAVIAGMYAVWHGPDGLRRIASGVRGRTARLARALEQAGVSLGHGTYFDTLRLDLGPSATRQAIERAAAERINVRQLGDGAVTVSLDEATTDDDVRHLARLLGGAQAERALDDRDAEPYPAIAARTSPYLLHPVFNRYHSETEMLRHVRALESRDFSLVHGMIPLGSCTMKLNATAEMYPVTWPEFGALHPFAPAEQSGGYRAMFAELEVALREITGFAAISLQPNAGSQGEYAGLLAIRGYHHARGDAQRTVCLIPQSAHGTNPASAVMAGLKVVVVKTDAEGHMDLGDLRAKAAQHAGELAALMVTYPSTHGVFEEEIREVCAIVHEHGGQVYMDGANMNAMVGLVRPGDLGADVCHLNLHKTFCIPHGGGGPGMGPIGVAAHLAPYLPGHAVVELGHHGGVGAVSAAPWGSASILPISYMYIAMMGGDGLTRATEIAILNANYIAKRLADAFPVLYKADNGLVAHECIIDPRPLKTSAGVDVEDIAKRLMDYGFHAPTVSFPVAGTLMIEPTESESKAELDRFCETMIAIRDEIAAIERGEMSRDDNPLSNAPHTALHVTQSDWPHPYTREQAAYPAAWLRERKFWPYVGRIESAYGDRNLVCVCPPVEEYAG
jgi:glycine dehydrogenase